MSMLMKEGLLLRLVDQTGDTEVHQDDLLDRQTPLLICGAQQLLGHHCLERTRKHRTDLLLLVGREDVDDSVHGLGR